MSPNNEFPVRAPTRNSLSSISEGSQSSPHDLSEKSELNKDAVHDDLDNSAQPLVSNDVGCFYTIVGSCVELLLQRERNLRKGQFESIAVLELGRWAFRSACSCVRAVCDILQWLAGLLRARGFGKSKL